MSTRNEPSRARDEARSRGGVEALSKAELYHAAAPMLVPGYDFLQMEAVRLIPFDVDSAFTCVDLGAGGGRLLRRVLQAFPRARGVCSDRSTEALAIARRYLREFWDRVTFAEKDLDHPWGPPLPERVDAVVTMSAIHHLVRDRKRELFAEIYRCLAPSGIFVNIDEVRAPDAAVHTENIRFWNEHVRRAARAVPGSEVAEYYRRYCQGGDDGGGVPGEGIGGRLEARATDGPSGADRHETWGRNVAYWAFHRRLETVEELARWLGEAGFDVVRVPVIYRLWACFGGSRAAQGGASPGIVRPGQRASADARSPDEGAS